MREVSLPALARRAPAEQPRYGPIALAGGLHFLNDAYGNVYPVLVPALMVSMHLRLVGAALIITASSLSASVLQPFAGRIADRLPGSRLMPLSLMVCALFTGLLGYSAAPLALLVMGVLAGVGNASFHPAASSWVAAMAGSRKGWSMSIFITAGNVGRALGPALMVLALGVWGARGSMPLAVPGLAVAVALLVWRVPVGARSAQRPAAPRILPLLAARARDAAALLVMSGARALVAGAVTTLVPIAYHEAGDPAYLAAILVGVLIFAGSVGNAVGGELSDRVARPWVVIGGAVGSALALAGFVNAGGVGALVLAGLTGFFAMGTNSVTMVMGQEMFPESVGMASGLALGVGNAVGIAMVGLLSVLAGWAGVDVALYAAAALALLAVPAALRFAGDLRLSRG